MLPATGHQLSCCCVALLYVLNSTHQPHPLILLRKRRTVLHLSYILFNYHIFICSLIITYQTLKFYFALKQAWPAPSFSLSFGEGLRVRCYLHTEYFLILTQILILYHLFAGFTVFKLFKLFMKAFTVFNNCYSCTAYKLDQSVRFQNLN